MTIRFDALFATLVLPLLPLAALTVATEGPVRPGEWHKNFPVALAQAKEQHRPLLVVCGGRGCAFCQRLNKAMDSSDFLDWQKARQVFMVHLDDRDELYKVARDFMREIDKKVSASPIVCVYWPKPSGEETRLVFSGRRGMMPSPKNKFLHIELINSLDGALADYIASAPGNGELRLDPLRDAKKISFAVAGGAGQVAMEPANGLLPDDNSVVSLFATNGSPEIVFARWRDPKGRSVAYTPRLDVESGMTEGQYVAEFKPLSGCPPPAFDVPVTSLWAKAGSRFKHQLDIPDTCRPVTLRAEGLPFGISLHPITGYISGIAWKTSTNQVTVVATSPNPLHKPLKKSFVLTVGPRK